MRPPSHDDMGQMPPGDRRRRTRELLSKAQRLEGAARAEVLERVIELNLDIAHAIARRYALDPAHLEEAERVARLALSRVVHRFDVQLGEDLLPHAVPSMRDDVRRHIRRSAWVARSSRRALESLAGS